MLLPDWIGDEASEVMTCAGDGFYPVMVGRDKDGKVTILLW